MSISGGVWDEAIEQLGRERSRNENVDDLIADLAARATAEASEIAIPALVEAFKWARSSFVVREVALAISRCAGPRETEAVELLVARYSELKGGTDVFLASAILEALTVLSLHNEFARHKATRLITEMPSSSSRYLLMRAAKSAGLLYRHQADEALYDYVRVAAMVDDLAVQSEAFYQMAHMLLARLLKEEDDDDDSFRQRVEKAYSAFTQSYGAEERRPDAGIYMKLLADALIECEQGGRRETIAADLTTRLGAASSYLEKLTG